MYRHRRKRRQHPGRTSGLLAAVGNKGAAAVAWPPARPAFGALAEICAPEKDQLDFTRALSVISEPAEARFEDMPSRARRCRKRTLAISHWPGTAKLWDGGTPRLLHLGFGGGPAGPRPGPLERPPAGAQRAPTGGGTTSARV